MTTSAFTRRLVPALLAVTAASLTFLPGCSTAPKGDAARDSLTADVQATLTRFTNTDPSLATLLQSAEGYAVFPNVGRAGFIAGGSFGRGEVFERGGTRMGFCDITQGTVGLQAGAQSFSQVVVFLTPQTFEAFKSNTFEFSANMSAVALTAGGAGSADYTGGVLVMVEPRGGLMAELSIGGQRFRFQPL